MVCNASYESWAVTLPEFFLACDQGWLAAPPRLCFSVVCRNKAKAQLLAPHFPSCFLNMVELVFP